MQSSSSSSLSVSLVATASECCVSCAASNRLELVKLRRLGLVSLGCCCLVATLSGYVIYKACKMRRTLDELEQRIDELSDKLDLIEEYLDNNNEGGGGDDADSDDQLTLVPATNKRTIQPAARADEQVAPPPLHLLSTSSSSSSLKQQRQHANQHRSERLSRHVSFYSLSDDDAIMFGTPDTSPERRPITPTTQPSLVDVEQRQAVHLDSADSNDDNRRVDRLLALDYATLSSLCSTNEDAVVESDDDTFVEHVRAMYVLGEKEDSGAEAKKTLQLRAYELAKRFLSVRSESYLAHKWCAMTVGKVIDYMGINDKIKYGFLFKEYLDNAIKLNDADYLLFYMRGRWLFRMQELSWAEKYAIRLLFGKIPAVSTDDAMNDFLRSEQLHSGKSKGNLLYLAKCHLLKNEKHRAIELLEAAGKLPIKTAEHELNNEEIKALKKKLGISS